MVVVVDVVVSGGGVVVVVVVVVVSGGGVVVVVVVSGCVVVVLSLFMLVNMYGCSYGIEERKERVSITSGQNTFLLFSFYCIFQEHTLVGHL